MVLGARTTSLIILLCSFAVAQDAKTFITLDSFDGSDGAYPHNSPVQGIDGNLYGTSTGQGIDQGTVYKITPTGTLTRLYSFCSLPSCMDGDWPWGQLTLGMDGAFYGTTTMGGTECQPWGCGTVYKITQSGAHFPLHSFDGTDGFSPSGELVQARDGNFYGTTSWGGANDAGTIFKITSNGTFTTLYNFCAQPGCTDGSHPYAGLVQARDENFYGMTEAGGDTNCNPNTGCGTVFRITATGKLSTLHTFELTDGSLPGSSLVAGTDGNFYGVTPEGGKQCPFYHTCGTFFRITAEGAFTSLYSFENSGGDGAAPWAISLGSDGNFFGTTNTGAGGGGTIFQVTPGGMLTTLHTFLMLQNGLNPAAGVSQANTGLLYGSTYTGGSYDWGTIYSLDVGLPPFVSLLPNWGKVGTSRGILGQGFTGTTAVSFNGIPASFTVVSDTFLKTTVPAGATTGAVSVTTPSGTLSSKVPFGVLPVILSFDPPSGPIGTKVKITGSSLTQTLHVAFGDRVPAKFRPDSDTQVTAIVPAGAKTGRIGIETEGGIAASTGIFTVTQ